MRKINAYLGILAMAACGVTSAANAQGPAMPGAPMATPTIKHAAAVKLVKQKPATQAATPTPTPSPAPIPTPVRFTAKGHISHSQRVNQSSSLSNNRAQIQEAFSSSSGVMNTVAPAPVTVNLQEHAPVFSMGAYPIQRESANR